MVSDHGPPNENIQNNPMQSSMVRPFERSRKNIFAADGPAQQAQIQQAQAEPRGKIDSITLSFPKCEE
jgi:hypothetical protein